MSICIHENCDQSTVEERPKKLQGALALSQLYCELHLEEASEEAEISPFQQQILENE